MLDEPVIEVPEVPREGLPGIRFLDIQAETAISDLRLPTGTSVNPPRIREQAQVVEHGQNQRIRSYDIRSEVADRGLNRDIEEANAGRPDA